MLAQLVFGVCSVMVLISDRTSAQMWNFDQAGRGGSLGWPGFGFAGGQQQQQDNTLTCIGKNILGDEMRVTVSEGRNTNNRWQPWGNRLNLWGGSSRPRVSAVISAGQGSNLYGQYQLVVTYGSRVEDGCSNRALGEILNDQVGRATWWGQPRTARGNMGAAIGIGRGQTASSSESLQSLTIQELTGRGLALCRTDQISGNTCAGPVQLCCKFGYDSQSATSTFSAQGQMFSGGMQGMQNGGMMGGMNQGLAGGLTQGSGVMGGLNQGGLSQGLNQGIAQPGLNSGLGQGNNNAQGMQGLSF